MLVYRGEKRFLSVELASVLAEGDSLTGTPTVTITAKRGGGATTMLVITPAAPAVSGTDVTFWVSVPAVQAVGAYVSKVSCATTNGETVVEKAPLLVQ